MNEDFKQLNKAIQEMVAMNNQVIKVLGKALDKAIDQKENFNKINCHSANIEDTLGKIKRYDMFGQKKK